MAVTPRRRGSERRRRLADGRRVKDKCHSGDGGGGSGSGGDGDGCNDGNENDAKINAYRRRAHVVYAIPSLTALFRSDFSGRPCFSRFSR